jgi:hypothetical protein
VAPGTIKRLVMGFWDAIPSHTTRRVIGAINIAFGIGLGWVAFVVF